jgi:hypothetical protein
MSNCAVTRRFLASLGTTCVISYNKARRGTNHAGLPATIASDRRSLNCSYRTITIRFSTVPRGVSIR